MQPKNVWGKIVLWLKENKKVALHVACGDITDIAIEGDTLFIRGTDDFLISVLRDGIKDLTSAIRWQGLNLKVEIVKYESEKQKKIKDEQKIARFFGSKLIK